MQLRKLQIISQTFLAQSFDQLQSFLGPLSSYPTCSAETSLAGSGDGLPVMMTADLDAVVPESSTNINTNSSSSSISSLSTASPHHQLLSIVEGLLNCEHSSVRASINCKDAVIAFGTDTGAGCGSISDEDMSARLQAHTDQCIALSAKVKELHTVVRRY